MKCAWPRCRRTDITVVYYDKPLCDRCWQRVDELTSEEMKAKLKVKEAP